MRMGKWLNTMVFFAVFLAYANIVSAYGYGTSQGTPYYDTYGSPGYFAMISGLLVLVILIVTIYLCFLFKSMLTRLVLIGTALILIGTVGWLYGDYAVGLIQYIWGGVIAIILGTVIWAYGDMRGGIFKHPLPGKLAVLGIILILLGTVIWLYSDYNGGIPLYIWSGVALLIVGTSIWLYGDAKAGAFLRRTKGKK
jgi:hypothetical protein